MSPVAGEVEGGELGEGGEEGAGKGAGRAEGGAGGGGERGGGDGGGGGGSVPIPPVAAASVLHSAAVDGFVADDVGLL